MAERVKTVLWGVRGSVPAPITAKEVMAKKKEVVEKYLNHINEGGHLDITAFLVNEEGAMPSTYGGNTSCVEVRYGDQIFVLDMGTGLRQLGNSLFGEMLSKKALEITFFLSHVHWDHIQGLPFFGPLYINKETGIKNKWSFFGGTNWQKTAEVCLKGQMDPPTFPVSWIEIEQITESITCSGMYDMKRVRMGDVGVCFGKLEHPQETYGSRLVFPDGRVVAYTTDNEPRNPLSPDPRLIMLAMGADIWITDCQYTKPQYEGIEGGVPRHGWGHSYPEAVAKTAVDAGVGHVILFHHDPSSSDERIKQIEQYTQGLISDMGGKSKVTAAHEGLELTI